MTAAAKSEDYIGEICKVGTIERHIQIRKEQQELAHRLITNEGLDIVQASNKAWEILFDNILEKL
jgi:hypothetical protein